MLFNSHVFILGFLPATAAGFFLCARLAGMQGARLWMLLASLVFYGWWSVEFLGLLLLSILANHALGRIILRLRHRRPGLARWLVALGVGGNLLLLGWYKYAGFLARNLDALTGLNLALDAVVLPLAICFYSFVHIAYLVDGGRGRSEAYGLLDYALFVTFFPHLIAGPIVHHHELIPQFRAPRTFRFRSEDAAAGLALFVTGLVKKMLLADPVSALATPVFAGAAQPGMAEAWMAVLAFSLGLYFDFSAYSDMAIGLARIFGIRFPHNFNSPYKALSISDFWRRWHMTLSRFLRDYVYIPLGGNRQGPARRHLNLVLTMLLGGLWHGAGWTFLVWGALHGGYLVVNHLWNGTGRRLSPLAARALTLLAVMFAWVFFAAPGLAEAGSVLSGMAGARGLAQPETLAALEMLRHGGIAALRDHLGGLGALISLSWGLAVLALGSVLVLAAPNSQEIVDGTPDGREARLPARLPRFRPGPVSGGLAAMALLLAMMLMANVREFVYFQF